MRNYAYLLLVFSAALMFSACGSGLTQKQSPGDQLYDNFRTAAAGAARDGYAMYWFGRGFEAAGMKFNGPYSSIFEDLRPGGAGATYDSSNGSSVHVNSYNAGAWAQAPEGRSVQPGVPASPNVIAKPVNVAGRDAVLRTNMERGVVAEQRMDWQIGDTHVAASTSDLRTPEGNVNPLIDEQTFLAVMENLRPYPQ
jgi:hypothetical protein